ncbi:hypothetical protein BD769DRAFT_1520361 [Suillus cothurnatus]|nr:hypothetical protein BD769DRAFT_1520361 [Suillus cothurnatus]
MAYIPSAAILVPVFTAWLMINCAPDICLSSELLLERAHRPALFLCQSNRYRGMASIIRTVLMYLLIVLIGLLPGRNLPRSPNTSAMQMILVSVYSHTLRSSTMTST